MKPSSLSILCLLGLCCLVSAQDAQEKKRSSYPSMAPIEQYRLADAQAEVTLARSAAPPSISADAEVLVLGEHGYETAVKGKNGFVCFVERSWAAGFDDPEFWNPKLRAPNCFNPPAVRSVLPHYLKRTEWVLAGLSRTQLVENARLAFSKHTLVVPEAGSFSFMLSKQGYLSDDAAGPWLPHVMLFVPHGQAVTWGAGLEGSPILGGDGSPFEPTVLFIPVRHWSGELARAAAGAGPTPTRLRAEGPASVIAGRRHRRRARTDWWGRALDRCHGRAFAACACGASPDEPASGHKVRAVRAQPGRKRREARRGLAQLKGSGHAETPTPDGNDVSCPVPWAAGSLMLRIVWVYCPVGIRMGPGPSHG